MFQTTNQLAFQMTCDTVYVPEMDTEVGEANNNKRRQFGRHCEPMQFHRTLFYGWWLLCELLKFAKGE